MKKRHLLFSVTVRFFCDACVSVVFLFFFFLISIYWLEVLTGAKCQRTVKLSKSTNLEWDQEELRKHPSVADPQVVKVKWHFGHFQNTHVAAGYLIVMKSTKIVP